MDILSVNLNNINLDNGNIFHEDDPYTFILIRLLAWYSTFKNMKI